MFQVIFIENGEKYNSVTTLILSLRFVSSIFICHKYVFHFLLFRQFRVYILEILLPLLVLGEFSVMSSLQLVVSKLMNFTSGLFYFKKLKISFITSSIAEISFVRENNIDVCGILSDLSANHLFVCSLYV